MFHPVLQVICRIPEMLTVWVFTGGKQKNFKEMVKFRPTVHHVTVQSAKTRRHVEKQSPGGWTGESWPLGATWCLASCQLNLITPQRIAKSLSKLYLHFRTIWSHCFVSLWLYVKFISSRSYTSYCLIALFCRGFCIWVNVAILSCKLHAEALQTPSNLSKSEPFRQLGCYQFVGLISMIGESLMSCNVYLFLPDWLLLWQRDRSSGHRRRRHHR